MATAPMEDRARRSRTWRSNQPAEIDQLAPAVGMLAGVGLSLPLWLLAGAVIVLARPHVDPMLRLVRAWASAVTG
jgi:hypothetical protein